MHLKNILTLTLCLVAATLFAQSSFETAIDHLSNSKKYNTADLSDIIISDEYSSSHNGITHLYLMQRHLGIEVKNSIVNFNLRDGAVLRAKGSFVRNISKKINTTQAVISAEAALQKVMTEHQIIGSLPNLLKTSNLPDQNHVFEKGNIAFQDIEVRLVFFNQDDQLKLCWEVSLYEKDTQHWWETIVDAQSGNILADHDHVLHCDFSCAEHNHNLKQKVNKTAKVILKKNATVVANSYRVYAYPVESPIHGNRSLEISPWTVAGDAGTLGWHDDGSSTYTHTKGNNVDAYEDHNNSNGPTGGNDARADGGTNLEFDFPIDFSVAPGSDPDPYVTNLFYWNNLIHDVWYQYGFDEASGNFQEDNLGRGGSGSDYVRAEAQDGGGTNNANFSTPIDGNNPRMQMYLWSPGGGFLTVNAPENVAGSYQLAPAGFGGSLYVAVTGDVVEVDDGSANPNLGCNALVNGTEMSGNIALVDRGGCQFGTKSLNAQNAGAIAVVVCTDDDDLFTMGGGDDGDDVTIPVVMITQSDCATIRAELDNGLNVTMIGSSENIDGDLDNGIIAHEYGHGISIRLTGGPGNSSCLNNAEQMGEGWSDFFGLWMTIEPNDAHTDARGIGTYALGESTSSGGIRPAPYTTDMGVNDYTYGDLDNTGNISQPHGIGFIWCTMIWDLNWAMIAEHGLDADIYYGAGGNNITAQLIIDGLKGQPCSPGFVDGRDAILDADMDNNAGANEDIIWNVFARRGLGYSADQGSSGSRVDQTEAFDLPPGVPFISEEDLFGTGPLPVELTNFEALPNQELQKIDLFWATSSETNNKGFDLQRKSENSDEFKTIAWVDGKGNSNYSSNYELSDTEVKKGLAYYYRLRQVDFDGRDNFSNVVTAKLSYNQNGIEVFPNPTKGITTVQFSNEIKGQVLLKVMNAQGQILTTQLFETNGNAEVDVDLSQQAEGIYFLKFEIGEEQFVKSVLVRK